MSSMVADPTVAEIPAGEWSIDPSWSAVEFAVTKIGLVSIKGRAPVVSGTIRGGGSASIEGTVDVRSITTFDERRDEHLRSPDFFDVERHPELRFASTSVELSDDGTLTVRGGLTVKGATTGVELSGRYLGSATDPWGNDRVALELAGTVDRTAFGLAWNAPLPGGGTLLPNEVGLKATFTAVRAA